MARRERKPLTQRERECRKAAREKATRKFVGTAMRRVRIGVAVLAGAGVVAAGSWEIFAGGISRTYNRTVDGMWRITADAGFTVDTLYLEGRSRSPLADVRRALGIKKGQPILALSLDDVRTRLEELPTIKHASVERALPGTVYVKLTERDPVALWQHDGKLSLIDDEGAAMEDLSLKDYQGLPLVAGKGAPLHVKEALELLAAQPDLASRVTALVRVSDRRWNVHLKGGLQVRLPEENALDAWGRVAAMAREEKLLERAILSIDMRMDDRMVIRLSPGALPGAAPLSARET